MKKRAQQIALCAMVTALGVVLMLVLGVTGIGTYAGPLLAAMLLLPVQDKYGTRGALTVWLVTGLLALLLVPDLELSIVYLTIFGWYPAVRPHLERLPRLLSLPVKLAAFNVAAIASYAVMMPFLGLEEEMTQPWLLGTMLVLGNALFLLEDRLLIPRVTAFYRKRFGTWFRK